jgi:NADPH:quinone reductase-like Zn-dependent oxidoreductase
MNAIEVYKSCHELECCTQTAESDEKEYPWDPVKRERRLASRGYEGRIDKVKIFEDASKVDNVQIECAAFGEDPLFRYVRTDMREEFERNELAYFVKVVVKIEATHISAPDVGFRRGTVDAVTTPFVMGSNFVGVIHHGPGKGRRVAAIVMGGANARYISTRPDRLMPVSKTLDPAEIALVLTTYLPTFQALHHGQDRPGRYSSTSLVGKRVIITEGATMLDVQALTHLAQYGQVSQVYVVANREHHDYLTNELKVRPLDVGNWARRVEGRMDVVVDFSYSDHSHSSHAALAPGGRLVWYLPPNKPSPSYLTQMELLLGQASAFLAERTTIYDFLLSWDQFHEEFEMDFHFLIELLAKRNIRPRIDIYVPLAEVSSAHKTLQSRSNDAKGAIICEPWKEQFGLSQARNDEVDAEDDDDDSYDDSDDFYPDDDSRDA